MKLFATILCTISVILLGNGLCKVLINSFGYVGATDYISNSAQATSYFGIGGMALFTSLLIFIICKLEDIRIEINRRDTCQKNQTEVIQENHL